MVGMFINTLPLRVRRSNETFAEAAGIMNGLSIQALRHSHVPLHKIVAAVGPKRVKSHGTLFQIMFQVGFCTAWNCMPQPTQSDALHPRCTR